LQIAKTLVTLVTCYLQHYRKTTGTILELLVSVWTY